MSSYTIFSYPILRGLRAIRLLTLAFLISANPSPAQSAADEQAMPALKDALEGLRNDFRARRNAVLAEQKFAYLKQLEAIEQQAVTTSNSIAAAAIRQERESPDLGITPLKIPSGHISAETAELQRLRSEFEKSRDLALMALNAAFVSPLQQLEQHCLDAYDPVAAAAAKAESEALQQPLLKILKADYGRRGRYTAATEFLRNAIAFNRLEIPCDNSLGGNPLPHVNKQVVIDFQVGSNPMVHVSFEQGTVIKLPRRGDLATQAKPSSVPGSAAKNESKEAVAAPKPALSAKPPGVIVLAAGWDSKFEGGSMTIGDLAALLHGRGTPGVSVAGDPSILVFENVPFLTPIEEAKALLRLTGKLPSRMLVACPGLPRDSLWYYAFDGHFEGHFNRLYLVTDGADQVISAQLVDETPRAGRLPTDRGGHHTYNFINYRVKALNTLVIDHKLTQPNDKVLVVDSVLTSPGNEDRPSVSFSRTASPRFNSGTDQREARILEQSRWYVPQPLLNLILHCVERR